jgi:hypothetical protein
VPDAPPAWTTPYGLHTTRRVSAVVSLQGGFLGKALTGFPYRVFACMAQPGWGGTPRALEQLIAKRGFLDFHLHVSYHMR